MQNSYDICSFINSYFIRQHIYPCVKCVFNTWYSCVKCTNPWMNKLRMIFIINLLHGKFLINMMLVVFLWDDECSWASRVGELAQFLAFSCHVVGRLHDTCHIPIPLLPLPSHYDWMSFFQYVKTCFRLTSINVYFIL